MGLRLWFRRPGLDPDRARHDRAHLRVPCRVLLERVPRAARLPMRDVRAVARRGICAGTYLLDFPVAVSVEYCRETARTRRTHSFFLLAGNVGTNLSFWVPSLVTSLCFFARLAMAFGVVLELEPEGPGVGGWSAILLPVVEGTTNVLLTINQRKRLI